MQTVYSRLPGSNCESCGYVVKTINDPNGPFQRVVEQFGGVEGAIATVTAEVRNGLYDKLTVMIGVCDPSDVERGKGYWADYKLTGDLGCRGRLCLKPVDPAKVKVLEHGSPDHNGSIGRVANPQQKR